MNYRFQNLLGAPYRGGNVVVTDNTLLISPVGNRISRDRPPEVGDHNSPMPVFLQHCPHRRLPRRRLPPGRRRKLPLPLSSTSAAASYSTACHSRSPSPLLSSAPMEPSSPSRQGNCFRSGGPPGSGRSSFRLNWFGLLPIATIRSRRWIGVRTRNYVLAGSKDLTVRLFCLKKFSNYYKPFLFLGHRDTIVGAFFGIDKKTKRVSRAYTLSRDGAIFSWSYSVSDEKFDKSGGESSEPLSPGTPKQRPNQNDDGDGNANVKKRKNFDEGESNLNDENGYMLHTGKWELLKKDFFMQAPAKLTACDYHRLLVWEWKSESYILKQQGHYFDVNCLAYSPDSQLLATGADDNKIKVWTVSSGFCFVTFSEHTNAVTALHFMSSNHCLLSASLDGTVRAWDLFRYRNFRTFTTPSSKQFVSLASDQSGEVICAGTLDSFETGRLLDVLSGHKGPVHGLMFSPTNAILTSSSWDKTVRLWDVFEGKGAVETFPHTHDVLTVVYRPDGKQLASSTLDGQIHFWDPIEGLLMYTIEGRRDIAGGRLVTDRRSAANSSSGKCFTTLCYSADGSYILAGGSSKYICVYDVADQVLLRRFQITHNLSLDGVLDFLNSKKMTDAGPLDLIDDDNSDDEEGVDKQTRGNLGYNLPGSMPNRGRAVIRTKCLRIAPTGRSWAAATTEGVLIYSMDESFIFDPTDLDIDVTPEAVDAALNEDQPSRALILSLRLNEDSLIKKCIVADLCKAHGLSIQQNSRNLLPALKIVAKVDNQITSRFGRNMFFQ
ncbi:periodic tryptophan protein 2 [Actinidia rufa]|uniref:Periodic tryptophan protein 2 n=1 Tax=Actinidia rufa TaxID=165716 RepID=A0A7J0FEE5_9ERIC|nr:periodic tryptophan protein 2 [Actinidia rufa]